MQKELHEGELESQRQNFYDAQESISALIKKGSTSTMSDDFVRDEFKRIKAMWRPWAKKWGKTVVDEHWIQEATRLGACRASSTTLERLHRAIVSLQSSGSLVINLLLAFDVCENIFSDPFFSVKAEMYPECNRWKETLQEIFNIGETSKLPLSSCRYI